MSIRNANSLLTWAARQAERIESRYSWRLGRFIRSATNKMARPNASPILGLGNQKSGTTVVAALLAQCAGESVTLDIDELTADVERQLHNGELSLPSFVRENALDFSRTIIKDPRLTFLYQQLADCFPDSKFVFVIRDPRDNIRSILNRLSIPGHRGNLDKSQLSKVSREWMLVLDGGWLGLEGKNYIEMLAARWNLAADIYLHNSDQMILVRYEDFVRDKVGKIVSLTKCIGLTAKNDIAQQVSVQYQPAGDRNITVHKFFGMENLRNIERICGPRMQRFGYTP